jgi:hypothetical protein
MSDAPQGPEWWLATDGKWYPLQQDPPAQPEPGPGWPTASSVPSGSSYAGSSQAWPTGSSSLSGPPHAGSTPGWPVGPTEPNPPRRRLGWIVGSIVTVLVVALGVIVIAGTMAHVSESGGTTGSGSIPIAGGTSTGPSSTASSGSVDSTTVPNVAIGQVSATSPLPPAFGSEVFSDDFHDPGSGWYASSLASGTTYAYGPSGYTITGKGMGHFFAFAPYSEPVEQLGLSLTATQSPNAPVGAGFGVGCRRGVGSSEIHYEFLLLVDRKWYVERYDGAAGSSKADVGSVLKQGSSPASPGAAAATVEGVCATLAGGHAIRLAFFINGAKVTDITDGAADLSGSGWLGVLVTASRPPTVSTVTATHWSERNCAL